MWPLICRVRGGKLRGSPKGGMYRCVYIYIYIHIHTYINTYIFRSRQVGYFQATSKWRWGDDIQKAPKSTGEVTFGKDFQLFLFGGVTFPLAKGVPRRECPPPSCNRTATGIHWKMPLTKVHRKSDFWRGVCLLTLVPLSIPVSATTRANWALKILNPKP